MPTEQEVIDAVVLDEEVPHFIREENKKIRALFMTARSRRGKKREEAFEKLQELVLNLLHSQYESYKGIISSLKVKSTKAWCEQDCSTAVVILRESVHKLILEKQAHQLKEDSWKEACGKMAILMSNLAEKKLPQEKPYSSVSLKTGYHKSLKKKSCNKYNDPEE